MTAEEYKFVFTEICPEQPSNETIKEEAQAYQRWKKANGMGRYNILTSMSNVMQHQHKDVPAVYDMVMSLKEMFKNQNRTARQVSIKELMNTNMTEGTSFRDHVLKLMSHLNELKILGAEIDEET